MPDCIHLHLWSWEVTSERKGQSELPLESFLTRKDLLVGIQWSLSSRFRDLIQHLLREMSRPCASGPKRIRLKTHWKDYTSQPALECLGILWKAALVSSKTGTPTCPARWRSHNSRRPSSGHCESNHENKTHQGKVFRRNSTKSLQRFV